MQFTPTIDRTCCLVLAFAAVHSTSLAQRPAAGELDATHWGIVYEVPAMKDVEVVAGVKYHHTAKGDLALDLYHSSGARTGAPRPAVVFLNAIGDSGEDKLKDWAIYSSWPRLVAAHGLVGVSMECDGDCVPECLREVFEFLGRQGSKHGIDGSRIGVYAASANVTEASRYLMGEGAARGIRAAALYYGWPVEGAMRRDLAVLNITAESDLANSRELLARLFAKATESAAPWTFEIAAGLPHGFDAFSDCDEARRVIQRTLAFWKSHLEPLPQPAAPPSKARQVVEASYSNDAAKLERLLGEWIAAHPNDASGYEMRGMARARARRSSEAKPDLEKALALGSTRAGVHGCLGMILAFEQTWETAVDHMQRAIEGGWRGSELYGTLGHAQLMLDRNADAVANYEAAFRLGIAPGPRTAGIAHYNLACGYARLGRTDDAFRELDKAVDEGFAKKSDYENDSDLKPLAADARFVQLLARMPAR